MRTSEAARVRLLRCFVFLSLLSLCVCARSAGRPCFVANNHKHALNNPSYAQFLREIRRSEAEVLDSSLIKNEFTNSQSSCTGTFLFFSFQVNNNPKKPAALLLLFLVVVCGMALHIALVANEAFARANSNKLEARIATACPEAFVGRGAMDSVDYAMTRRPADKVFAQASAS